jgi:uncharacterized tellurite resistance protein B-like protein
MQNIQLTPYHILGFIYIAFAHQTDGEFSHEEQRVVWQKVKQLIGDALPYSEFTKLMDEVTRVYKLKMNEHNIEDIVMELAEQLLEHEWFTKHNGSTCLHDLKDIALADSSFHEKEKRWIAQLANIWGVNAKIINKL